MNHIHLLHYFFLINSRALSHWKGMQHNVQEYNIYCLLHMHFHLSLIKLYIKVHSYNNAMGSLVHGLYSLMTIPHL